MKTNGLLNFLDRAPYGAFAVDMNRTVVFWNRGAERILELQSDETIGRSCCEVLAEITQNGNETVCAEGCPSVAFVQRGHVPGIIHLEVLSGSGQPKPITLTPLVVHEDAIGERLLVLLFHELGDPERAGRIATAVGGVFSEQRIAGNSNGPTADGSALRGDRLTGRELEILRFVAMGLSADEISAELRLSSHTVLNHIRSLRSKLDARDRLGAVLAGHRLGLL